MSNSIQISPESLEVANVYLETGSLAETSTRLGLPANTVTDLLDKPEIKRYVDNIYMDKGYRNRFKMSSLMDKIIEAKLEEIEESEIYTSKDLLDILALQHKMKIEEMKLEQSSIKNQTNIQVNNTGDNIFGSGNYGALMEKLLGPVEVTEIVD